MSFFKRLIGKQDPRSQPLDQDQFFRAFRQFTDADSWDELQRIVEQNPILLHPDADEFVDQIAAVQPNPQNLRVVEEHGALLRHCRQAGIPRAFAEEMLSPKTLAQAAVDGVTPEQALEMVRAAEQQDRLDAAQVAGSGTDVLRDLVAILEELAQPATLTDMTRRAQLCRQALTFVSRQQDPQAWAMLQTDLGMSLVQIPSGDRAANLEQAIAAFRQAMEVRSRQAMPVEWANVMNNLAGAYSSRIQGDRAANLEQAIAAYRQALEVRTRPAWPAEWATVMMNLANAYQNRTPFLAEADRAENLEQAIEIYRQVLEVRTRQALPAEWAQVMVNLGTAYQTRTLFLAEGDRAGSLEQAIAAYRQALEVMTRQAMPIEWATVMMDLANAYQSLAPFLADADRAQNLEVAIAAYRQALEVRTRSTMPVEWAQVMSNLANVYSYRASFSVEGNRAANLAQAIAAYRQALEILTPDVLPDDCRRAARGLASLCFVEGRYAQVVEPYRLVMRATDALLNGSLARGSKEVELSEIQGLPANAAHALAKLGRLEEAVEALEAGRARLLAEALEEKRHDLERLAGLGHGELLDRYRAAAGRIAALQTQAAQPAVAHGPEAGPPCDFAALSQEIQVARSELDAAIAAIREVPGYEDFFLSLTFDKIRRAAAPDGALGYLVVTSAGGLTLVVHNSQTCRVSETRQVSAVWLDGITEVQLRAKLNDHLEAYARRGQPSRDRTAWDAWLAALDGTTRWLWDAVMGPLTAHLTAMHAAGAVLIPTGLLALLPLHGAWTEDAIQPTGRRYALDEVAFSYAASAVALIQARENAAAALDGRLLAVDEPRPVSGNVLPNSAAEVAAIASLFQAPHVLRHGQATRAAVLDALPRAQVIHLSCHGAMHWAEPLRSGVVMAGDEMLTVGDLLDRRLPAARLATLSACETGIAGTALPDEVVALPTALAQAGYAGVAASLWSVADASTAMLMERFYRLWRIDGLSPALALREAQRWLRDTTNREKAEYFRRDVPTLSAGKMPEKIAADFFSQATMRRPGDRDFAHPFWWAAFYLTGV